MQLHQARRGFSGGIADPAGGEYSAWISSRMDLAADARTALDEW